MEENKIINVVIIEDDKHFSQLIKDLLLKDKSNNYNVNLFENLDEGLIHIDKNSVDLLILDLNLPDCHGIDTLLKVHLKDSSIPIIILSGVNDEQIMINTLKVGAQDYIIKGEADIKKIIRTINFTIERCRIQKAKLYAVSLDSNHGYFQNIIDNNNDSIIILDTNYTILYLNKIAQRIFENKSKKIVGEKFPLNIDDIKNEITKIPDKYNVNHYYDICVGETELASEKVFIVSFKDITKYRKYQDKLKELTYKDTTTKLYNSRGFKILAYQHYKVAKRQKIPFLMFFFDLDGLKKINDQFGHQEGEKSIKYTAEILSKTFRDSDIKARWGGDEFVVLALNSSENQIITIKNRLNQYLRDYNKFKNISYDLSLSVGVSVYNPQDPISLKKLLIQADTLMYEDKKLKKKNKSFAKKMSCLV